MQHRLVILHSEEEYAYALMDYMNQQKAFPFEVTAFTEKDLFLEYLKTHKVQMLLLEEELTEEEIRNLPAIACYLLVEEPKITQLYGKQCIFRYQSAKNIMEKLVQYYTLEGHILYNPKAVSQCRVIIVLSPIYTDKQTLYSKELATGLSHTVKTLYVNFHPFVTTELFGQRQEFLVSEAIDIFQTVEDRTYGKLISCIRHNDELDYLVGIEQFQDLCELDEEEVLIFVQKLIKESSYEAVVLDIPIPCHAIPALLPLCDEIYEVIDRSVHTDMIRKEFLRQVSLLNGGEKCREIDITCCSL